MRLDLLAKTAGPGKQWTLAGRKEIKTSLDTLIVIAAMGIVAPAIAAHKPMQHHAPQGNASCKSEFMQMKDGKCMDARTGA